MKLSEVVKKLKELEAKERKLKVLSNKIQGSIVKKYVRCGKEKCKTCKFGKGHGPYYYLVTYENGKQKWKYMGKTMEKINKSRKLNLELRKIRKEKKKLLIELKKIVNTMLKQI